MTPPKQPTVGYTTFEQEAIPEISRNPTEKNVIGPLKPVIYDDAFPKEADLFKLPKDNDFDGKEAELFALPKDDDKEDQAITGRKKWTKEPESEIPKSSNSD